MSQVFDELIAFEFVVIQNNDNLEKDVTNMSHSLENLLRKE